MSGTAQPRSLLDAHPYAVLAVGVAAVSTASIWVRWSRLPPPVLAFYRLGFSAALLWPAFAWHVRRLGLPRHPPGWLPAAALAGVALAGHWAVWFASLSMTTVLSSTVLVTTQPVFVVALAYALWRERLNPGQGASLALAAFGAAMVALGDAGAWRGASAAPGAGAAAGPGAVGAPQGGHSLRGDGLALLAAGLVSVYLLTGQRLRRWVPLVPYLTVVYSAGAVALLALNAAAGLPALGWPAREVGVGLGIAAVPTLLGHSALNLVVGRLGAATVATAVLGEPIGASLLAVLLFGEVPGLLHGLGAVCILAGIYRFVQGGRPARREMAGDAAGS